MSDAAEENRPSSAGAMSTGALPVDDPTRQALITAAAAVFSEKGYDGAGVQEIARRAGFTTGAIYGRFRGKAELLLAAIDAYSRDELSELFAEHRQEGNVTNIVTTVGSHLVTEPFDDGQALLLEAFVAARRDPEVATLMRERMEERVRTFSALIDQAKEEGLVDPDFDTETVVRFCHSVGFGFLLIGALSIEQPGAEPWEQLIARLVDAIGPA